MAPVLANLSKLIDACGSRPVFVLTPLPRHVTAPCCLNKEHCTHLTMPDYGVRISCEIVRLNKIISGRLRHHQNVTIVCTGDILAGKENAAPTEVLSAMTNWSGVHGPQEAYTKISLKLLSLFSSNKSGYLKLAREDSDGGEFGQLSRSDSFWQGAGGSQHLVSYPL